jgi:hypothetical protein
MTGAGEEREGEAAPILEKTVDWEIPIHYY